MKIILLAVGLLIIFIIPANAAFKICLYSDPAHQSTHAYDQSPGTLSVYVVHEEVGSVIGGSGAAFRIAPSPGFTGVWIGETSPFLVLGASPSGIALAYGGCFLATDVLQVQYAIVGTSAGCSALEVVTHPDYDFFGGPIVSPCHGDDPILAAAGRLTINPNASCSPVPVAPTTWGAVKALYR